MRISGSYNSYSVNNTETISKKSTSVRDYQKYLTQKFGCLTPGKNAAVSVTGGLLRKAMSDEKTGEWLERELGKATDYIEAAQKAAISHGSTLKSVSIEFGEEYSTMTTVGVFGDEGGTDPEIDKWLEKIKEKRDEQKAADKRLEQKNVESQRLEGSYKLEVQGKDLADLTNQFAMKLSMQAGVSALGGFDVKA
ncbi:hypothetical protein SAMN02745247_01127 [Butyrivibrio hungatei DSM 14810]|uniref:Uncharacterized protein n=1 Tax=Butyrivibrio hungatei DSM 14810 TaxID=1121132 RepID=A0A1M7S6A0_9FIRM|nr:hypothetical protein [Butyrivibrio hungatei]SHN53981.1 hypothetical protein SAMN02745247_01127 [Butyrivibrio hungatei DSM 14810]